METIIVEIYLPGVSQSYDFVMPAHVPVGSILDRLIDLLKGYTNIAQIDAEHPCLCDMMSKRPIPLHKTLSQCGVRDSWRLMLL